VDSRTPRRKAIALLGLGLLASILILAWKLGGADEAPPSAAPRKETTPLGASPRAWELVEVRPEREAVAPGALEPEPPAPEDPPPAREPRRSGLVVLNGAAVRVDSDGIEHAGDDGGFHLFWSRGADRGPHQVEVLAGSFSVEVPSDVSLYVRDLVLGGKPLRLDVRDITVPAERFVTLRGTEMHDVLLHVLSSADRRELEGVEVWPGPYGIPTAVRHPGEEPQGEPIARAASSPVPIPPSSRAFRSSSQYFVRAPGHAWGSVAIDHAAGGERTLVLEPACALTIELIGNAEWLEPEVRLWPPDASKSAGYAFAAREPDSEDRAVFEFLPPGTYIASVERGWAGQRESYGRAEVSLLPGERAHVTVRVDLPERPTGVTAAGTLTLPSSWGVDGLKLVLSGEGETQKWAPERIELGWAAMAALPDGPRAERRRAWRIELPTSGSYRLVVLPLAYRRLLEVPAGGLEGVDLDVPQPADVEVRVVDVDSGEQIEVESMYWSGARVEGLRGGALYTAVADPETGRVRFRAPAGDIQVHTKGSTLMLVGRDGSFTVEPGPNLLEVAVHRQIGVRFAFKDGEAAVPWSWDWRLGAHRLDGQARDESRSIGMLWFQQEGTYELRSNGIPGYQSIDGTRFEVVAGQGVIEVEVQLVRE
jgi:hypothetical protein